jgi:hypothetical protein
VLACYGIGFGLFSLPTALIVGPHLLLVSVCLIAVGTSCLLIARGLARGNASAWWGAAFVSLAILVVFLVALVRSIVKDDTSGVVFFALASSFILTVFLVTLAHRKMYLV